MQFYHRYATHYMLHTFSKMLKGSLVHVSVCVVLVVAVLCVVCVLASCVVVGDSVCASLVQFGSGVVCVSLVYFVSDVVC